MRKVENKQIRIKDKQEIEGKSEMTKAGPVFVPPVDIYEDEDALVMVADMPGVEKDGIDIHLEDNELSIQGQVKKDESVLSPIYIEYKTGDYFRRFTLPSVIDREKIDATIASGVLKVILPKAEAAKPRKIIVRGG